nr:hypothetical protein [uncultured Treponema sp.]
MAMDMFNSMENKQILIQDVGNTEELQRFIGHNIYRRHIAPADRIDFLPRILHYLQKNK